MPTHHFSVKAPDVQTKSKGVKFPKIKIKNKQTLECLARTQEKTSSVTS